MKLAASLILSLLFYTSFSQSLYPRKSLDPILYPFYHGVASGDPLSDAVILWTRFTDDTLSSDSVEINWRIATDTTMSNVINSGNGYAHVENDWTFKVDAIGLSPGTWYYYDFEALDYHSIRGRTKTAPVGDNDSARFAVVSCSNYEHGYFNAYRYLRDRNDFDAVLHLGDYIYEYAAGGYSAGIVDRDNEPINEIITLEDYRIRYSHYRLDDDLRDLHQQYPFINVWDDHESANDSYFDGAQNHSPGTEGPWIERKSNSAQAYHEWLPIRSPIPGGIQIYREIKYGDLMSLLMLDTRLNGRSQQGGSSSDPTRTILGQDQFSWLTNNLKANNAKWKILGQQVMLSPLEIFGTVLNDDQWDGYDYERNRLFDSITTHNIENIVVLTGDIHSSWVNDIPLNNYNASNCTGSIGVEYVVTSVTSPGLSFLGGVATGTISLFNPHIQYTNLSEHGYLILDVSKTKVTGNYYYMNSIDAVLSGEYFEDAFYVLDGEKCVQQASGPTQSNNDPPIFAPDNPINGTAAINGHLTDFTVFGTYPNPFYNDVTIQLFLANEEAITFECYDVAGKLVFRQEIEALSKGLNYVKLYLSPLSAGTYSLVIKGENHYSSKKLVKSY
jgi:alkaline phosphatase D